MPRRSSPWRCVVAAGRRTNRGATPDNIVASLADQTEGLAQEVLYSNNVRNLAPTASSVGLDFTYALAKVKVVVTAEANMGLTANDFAAMTGYTDGLPAVGATNRLRSLDLSDNTALKKLGCNDNQLTSLDISKNTRIDTFACRNNPGDGVSTFPVTAWFDDSKIPSVFNTASSLYWYEDGKQWVVKYIKAE